MSKDYQISEEWISANEPEVGFYGSDSLNALTYKIIGICFDVHNELGNGFLEVVYKEAIEYEFEKHNISFVREKKYEIKYKEIILSRSYNADFNIEDQVILEVKAQNGLANGNLKQVINYLAVSGSKIGLLVNFGEESLKYKRLILTKKSAPSV